MLSVEHDGHVATVWLDSHKRRNALGLSFWAEYPRVLRALDDDPKVRAIVLAAKGDHFTVGLDLKEMGGQLIGGREASPALTNKRFLDQIENLQRAVSTAEEIDTPVVTATHGWCIGGGLDVITACDVRVAAADCVFTVRETRMAMVADLGTLQRLPRLVGHGVARELALTGRDFTAEYAEKIGLVTYVAGDAASAQRRAMEIACEIAELSPLATRGTKAVLRTSAERTVAQGLEYVGWWNTAFFRSGDLNEAIGSFMEKRPPQFRGE